MKINYYGRRINGRFDSFKAWMKRMFQWLVRIGVLTGIVIGAFLAGGFFYSTSTVTASTKTIQMPVASPVLDRIADCESGNGKKGTATHFRNGQVLIKPNTNGTVDVGKYQVNSVWFKKASDLGYDITKETDNKAMAEWIYLNRGTGDWYPSAKCWQLN